MAPCCTCWTLAAALLCLSVSVSAAQETRRAPQVVSHASPHLLRNNFNPWKNLRDSLSKHVWDALDKICPASSSQIPGRRCSCPSGFVPCAGRCYTRLSAAVDYHSAELECAALGTFLAVPRSIDESICVAGLAGYQVIWTGVTDIDEEGVWQGADGKVVPVSEQNWADHQPDNEAGSADCVEIRPVSSGFRFAEWNDRPCNVPNFPMCQLPDMRHHYPV